MDCTEQIEELNSLLTDSGQSYHVVERKTAGHVKVAYVGEFQQQPVIWQVQIWSIPAFRKEYGPRRAMRQFIQIEQGDDCHLEAQVILNRENIREADILATMIMLRKYKRLALGRHEYGEFIQG